jgi:hypothetical protein
VKLFGERLYFAPLSRRAPPVNILDIATGTGDWAIKMGDLFPETEVVATDLSPIQPRKVPPNVNFYVEDSYVNSIQASGDPLKTHFSLALSLGIILSLSIIFTPESHLAAGLASRSRLRTKPFKH